MLLALVLLNICYLIALIGGVWYAKRRIGLLKQSLVDSYVSYFNPKGDKEDSDFNKTLDYVSYVMARRFINTFNAVSMQQSSVASRITNQLEQDIASDTLAAESPGLSLILDQMPSVKKRLMKNPQYLQYAFPLLQKYLQPKNGNGVGKVGGNGVGKVGSVAKRIKDGI